MNHKRPHNDSETPATNGKHRKLALLVDLPILPQLVIEHILGFLYAHEYFIPALVCNKWRSYLKNLNPLRQPVAAFVCGYAYTNSIGIVRFLLNFYLGKSVDENHHLFDPVFIHPSWLRLSPNFNSVITLKGAAAFSCNLAMVVLVQRFGGTYVNQRDIEFVCFNPNGKTIQDQKSITRMVWCLQQHWHFSNIELQWIIGAVCANNIVLFTLFVRIGITQNLELANYMIILRLAVSYSNFSTIRFILENVREFGHSGCIEALLEQAIRKSKLDIIKYVMSNWNGIMFRDNHTLFLLAAKNTDVSCMELLHKLGFECDFRPWEYAIKCKFFKHLKFLHSIKCPLPTFTPAMCENFVHYSLSTQADKEIIQFLRGINFPMCNKLSYHHNIDCEHSVN